MDVRIVEMAARQHDLVAGWQLRRAGFTPGAIKHRVEARNLRAVHAGVYAIGHAPLSQRQLWVAAVLTAPGSVLRHRGRPGSAFLAQLHQRYAHLPYDRTRSNAEARALEVLTDAGVPPPRVNTRISGEEADLAWPARGLVIEIDGPDFHRFRDE